MRTPERIYINKINGLEFCVNHYTGKVTYDSKEMPDRNRNFLPPEIIDTLRQSNDSIIKSFFTSKLSKAGNLCGLFEDDASADPEKVLYLMIFIPLSQSNNKNNYTNNLYLKH